MAKSFLLLLYLCSVIYSQNVPLALLSNTKETGATCNDGTPAGYYFYPGLNADKWIPYLQGGALCFNADTCAGRINTTLSSSNVFPPFMSTFVPSSSMFSDWSQVYIPYCTSDLYVGQNNGTQWKDIFNFTFNGHLVLREIIADLKMNHNLNSATDFLVVGESAGGVGVINNMNWFKDQLPNAIVRGVPNSGIFLGIQNWLGEGNSNDVLKALVPLYNPYIDPYCLDATHNTTKCLETQILFPFIQSDMFVVQSLIDSYEVFVQLGVPSDIGDTQVQQYIADVVAESYRSQLSSILQDKSTTGWYLLTCLVHVPNLNEPIIENTSPLEAISYWYSNVSDTAQNRYGDFCDAQSAVSYSSQFSFPVFTSCKNVANRCTKTANMLDPVVTEISSESSQSISQEEEGSNSAASSWPKCPIIIMILAVLVVCEYVN